MNICISLSGVYEEEGWSERISGLDESVLLDMRGLEGTNSYCSEEAEEALTEALAPLPLRSICWIDTGDYHYLSYIRMKQADRPFALVLLDNHPDDQEAAFGMLSCGSWVAVARDRNPLLKPLEPGIPVFLSIDTDVLSTDFASTDWNQGSMTLDELESQVRALAAEHEIIGIDICGGLTRAKGATDSDLEKNIRLRERLLSLTSEILQRGRT